LNFATEAHVCAFANDNMNQRNINPDSLNLEEVNLEEEKTSFLMI
jgi:hypothetical protein